MKKIIGILLMVSMMLLLLSSCGIPREEHDAVVAERDDAQTQVASLHSDLAEVESQIEILESGFAATQSNLAAKESELAEAEGQISSLKSDLATMEVAKASAESALAEEEARVAELEAQIAELEVEKTDLEAQLEAATEEEADGYKLLLISEVLFHSFGRLGVRGEVKNISDESLENIQVVIDIYEYGSLDRSAKALIHSNPLRPGETTSFEVSASVSTAGGPRGSGIKKMYFKYRDPHIIPHTTE